jgi:hypothetical protein
MSALTLSHRLDDARAIARLLLVVAPDECAAGLTAILRLLDAAENSAAEAIATLATANK